MDVRKLGRIRDAGGWRDLGGEAAPRSPGRRDRRDSPRIGVDYDHAAVDDHSRLAYAEIHPDERGTTCAGVLLRAAAFFPEHGICIREVTTDNAALRHLEELPVRPHDPGPRHLLIKAYCPGRNGKAERVNRTLQAEWARRQPFTTKQRLADALGPWLDHYNNDRNHQGIGGKLPTSRVPSRHARPTEVWPLR